MGGIEFITYNFIDFKEEVNQIWFRHGANHLLNWLQALPALVLALCDPRILSDLRKWIPKQLPMSV